MKLDCESAELRELAEELWPLHRSVVGRELDRSLDLIKRWLGLDWTALHEVKSGAELPGGWVVPHGWSCIHGSLRTQSGSISLSYDGTNLRVPSHSASVSLRGVTIDEISESLYFHGSLPNAIPYITDYYGNNGWGFCLSQEEYESLQKSREKIDVEIQTERYQHSLKIAEMHIGNKEQFIVINSYLCHPSMANNELSGPLGIAALIRRLSTDVGKLTDFGVKFLIWPETIGAICYTDILSKSRKSSKPIPSLTLSCIGMADREFSVVGGRSKCWNRTVSGVFGKNVEIVPWSQRGSDERQLNFPCSKFFSATVSRGRFGAYPEYHTNLDNLDLICFETIIETIDKIQQIIFDRQSLEFPFCEQPYEPFLSKFGIYPSISKGNNTSFGKDLCELLHYCNGLENKERIKRRLSRFDDYYLEKLFDAAKRLRLISC